MQDGKQHNLVEEAAIRGALIRVNDAVCFQLWQQGNHSSVRTGKL